MIFEARKHRSTLDGFPDSRCYRAPTHVTFHVILHVTREYKTTLRDSSPGNWRYLPVPRSAL